MKARGAVVPSSWDRRLNLTPRSRRRWRARTARVRAHLEAGALIALAVVVGAWLGRVL